MLEPGRSAIGPAWLSWAGTSWGLAERRQRTVSCTMEKALVLPFLGLLLLIGALEADHKPPRVQVYSRYPAEKGKANTLNCYVDQFHPPKINITLEKNGQQLPGMQTSDLSFADDWTFQLLVHADITPNGNDKYTCRVDHVSQDKPKFYQWDQEY